MSSSELASRLEDILEAIAVIGAYTSGKTQDDYAAERMLRDAVERNVERISEASRHIPRDLRSRHSEVPWRKVAGIGNILRHAYPIVDDSLIWEAVVRDLPPLKLAVEQMLAELTAGETDKQDLERVDEAEPVTGHRSSQACEVVQHLVRASAG